MSPFRWDVLLVSFVLALPVLAMGLRGELSAQEMTLKLPWCLLGGYAAVALIRWAGKPRGTTPEAATATGGAESDDSAPSPAA